MLYDPLSNYEHFALINDTLFHFTYRGGADRTSNQADHAYVIHQVHTVGVPIYRLELSDLSWE